jgi:hypothetical protein
MRFQFPVLGVYPVSRASFRGGPKLKICFCFFAPRTLARCRSGYRIPKRLPMLKADKRSVDYSRGHRDAHFGHAFENDKNYCRFFIEPSTGAHDLGACEKVSGAIGRVYWCRLFARAHSK